MEKALKERKRIIFSMLVSACITGFIMLIVYALNGNMGFGRSTLTIMDGEVQYVDFFCYLQDVLKGADSFSYTFNKGLGGSGVAILAYYLASPFNIIVLLIPKAMMPVITDILLLLKTITAALFCALALAKRFPNLKNLYIVILSAGYSLMHWNLVQSSNIMWLDGAYMLPLILLGVYVLVNKESFIVLSLSLGLSILFNWYTGAFNCIFACLWFVVEIVIFRLGEHRKNNTGKTVIKFIIGMAAGVSLSMVMLLPNILALRAGKGSEFDLHGLIGGLLGNPVNIIQNNTAGVYNFRGLGYPSVFCGSIVLIAVITLFRSLYFSVKEKLLTAVVLILAFATFYLRPFYFIMCLLKQVDSYEYRHEYLITMIMVFFAAWYLERTFGTVDISNIIWHDETQSVLQRKEAGRFLQDGILAAAVILILNFIFPGSDKSQTGASVSIAALPVIALCIYLNVRQEASKAQKASINKKSALILKMPGMILCLIIIAELFIHVFTIVKLYNNDNMLTDRYSAHSEYVEQLKQVMEQESIDPAGAYRLSQTVHRDCDEAGRKATLNDGLAYNIMTNATYSSCTENIQVQLMDRLGYKGWAGVLNVVNTSVLPSDALIGVRYVTAIEPISGLEPLNAGANLSEAALYENPYALPILYTVSSDIESAQGTPDIQTDTFSYINDLYHELVPDIDSDIFIPAKASVIWADFDKPSGKYVTVFQVESSKENWPVYLEAVNEDMPAQITVNGTDILQVGQWLSDRVIYLPEEKIAGQTYAIAKVASDKEIKEGDISIYQADLGTLKACTDRIKAENTVTDFHMENGFVSATAFSEGSSYLQTSIMATDGWGIMVNGKKTDPEIFADSLIRIPLEDGENNIEMIYSVPGHVVGLIWSLAAFAFLVAVSYLHFRNKNLSLSRKMK